MCVPAGFAKQFLYHIIVGQRPMPTLFQPPPIDYVADQVERFGIMAAQKNKQQFGLAALRSQMDIGQKWSSKMFWERMLRGSVNAFIKWSPE